MDYLEAEQQVQLVDRLKKGTQRSTYSWKPMGDDEYSFLLVAGKFGFLVQSRDKDDYAPFSLTVYEIASTKSKELQVIDTDPDRADLNAGLEDLYELVKRKSLRLDTIASEIFSELDSIDGVKDGDGEHG